MIEIMQSISQSTWQSLPNDTKARLRGKFKMKQSDYANPPYDGLTQGDISSTFTVENINSTMEWNEKDLFTAFEKLILEISGVKTNKIIENNETNTISQETTSKSTKGNRVETKKTDGSDKEIVQSVQGTELGHKESTNGVTNDTKLSNDDNVQTSRKA